MALWRVPVNISYTATGGPAVNIWHVETDSAIESHENNLQDAVNEIQSFYNFLCQSGTTPACIYPAGTVITLGEVINMETDESAEPTFTSPSTSAGGTPAPPVLQVCVSWKTSVRARRGMGRTFLGPLSVNCIQTDGTIVPGVITQVNAAAQALVDDSNGPFEWSIGVWGQQNKLPSGATPEDRRAAPHVFRATTDFKVRDKFAVLRSRRD